MERISTEIYEIQKMKGKILTKSLPKLHEYYCDEDETCQGCSAFSWHYSKHSYFRVEISELYKIKQFQT